MTDTTTDVTTVQGTGTVTIPDSTPPTNDTLTVRIVVILLGIVALSIIVAASLLALDGKELPDSLLALAGVAVGALGAMLASTASRRT